jgi:ADP-ribosyl-[dinitrogen reductase] hydrolase
MDKRSRFRGSLLGLAVGDAVGTTVEFHDPGTFPRVTDMVGGGPFNLTAGEWTDDTSMALCLAESLIECRELNAEDQMRRYLRWYREGYMSVKGRCFDIGNTTRLALLTFEETGYPYSWEMDLQMAGNGSLMRLAPVPLLYVNGVDKETLLGPLWCPINGYWDNNKLTEPIDEVASGSFKLREPPEIRGTGYVVKCLEAALWAFHRSSSFKEGCLMAVNLGEDADTTTAVYGQIAGAYYGYEAIPQDWRKKLAMNEKIIDYADRLNSLSETLFK